MEKERSFFEETFSLSFLTTTTMQSCKISVPSLFHSRHLLNPSRKRILQSSISFSSKSPTTSSRRPNPFVPSSSPSSSTRTMSTTTSSITSTSNCVPCKSSSTQPLTEQEHESHFQPLSQKGWQISTDSTSTDPKSSIKVLSKTYRFKNWKTAQKFVERIGEVSEEQGHHPTLLLSWGMVKVEWWTHTVKGVGIYRKSGN